MKNSKMKNPKMKGLSNFPTIVFLKGTWTVGMHAFNRTSEDGKKVFSSWSNLKKATVK